MSTPTLTYFDGRGLGAAVRIALCAAGVEFKEVYLESREQFLELRDTNKPLLFGQVPLLEIEGQKIVQSRAICNYIGRKYNFYGKNNEEATMIDMLVEGARDFYAPFYLLLVEGTEEETVAKFRTQFPKYMTVFEKVLADNGKQYLVGDSLSLADLGLFEVLLSVEEFMGADSINEYPKVKDFYNLLKNLPTMQHFLKNYRTGKNTEEFIKGVRATLAF